MRRRESRREKRRSMARTNKLTHVDNTRQVPRGGIRK